MYYASNTGLFCILRRTADYTFLEKTLNQVWKQFLNQIQHDQFFAEYLGSDEWKKMSFGALRNPDWYKLPTPRTPSIEKDIDFLKMEMLRMRG